MELKAHFQVPSTELSEAPVSWLCGAQRYSRQANRAWVRLVGACKTKCTFNTDVQSPCLIQPWKETKAIVYLQLIFLQEKNLVSVFDTWTKYVCVAAGMTQWTLIAFSGFLFILFAHCNSSSSPRRFAYKPLLWPGFRFGYLLSEI